MADNQPTHLPCPQRSRPTLDLVYSGKSTGLGVSYPLRPPLCRDSGSLHRLDTDFEITDGVNETQASLEKVAQVNVFTVELCLSLTVQPYLMIYDFVGHFRVLFSHFKFQNNCVSAFN